MCAEIPILERASGRRGPVKPAACPALCAICAFGGKGSFLWEKRRSELAFSTNRRAAGASFRLAGYQWGEDLSWNFRCATDGALVARGGLLPVRMTTSAS